MDEYREFMLDNGLFVALQRTPSETVAGRLRVWHGALNERKGEEGLAHLLEHVILAGGSKKYTPEESDKLRLTIPSINASTGQRKTIFKGEMLTDDVDLFLEYVADISFNPSFDQERFSKEKSRVLREVADKKSNPLFMDNRTYAEAVFGKDSPHAYSPLGNETIIKNATVDDLRKFHSRGYYPNNMDILIAGSLPERLEKLIQRNFAEYKVGSIERVQLPANEYLTDKTIIHTYAPDLYNYENPLQSSAQLGITFIALAENEEDAYALEVLAGILSQDSDSGIFKEVSQKKGIAYSLGAHYHNQNNQGLFCLGGKVDASRKNEAIESIFEKINELKEREVSETELYALKRKYQYNTAKSFETNRGIINAIELKIDKGITPKDYIQKQGQVTPAKLKRVAEKYLPSGPEEKGYVLLLRDPLKE